METDLYHERTLRPELSFRSHRPERGWKPVTAFVVEDVSGQTFPLPLPLTGIRPRSQLELYKLADKDLRCLRSSDRHSSLENFPGQAENFSVS
ncbi:MAG: hypothetical protein ACYTXE_39215 [Nostoc sp.]